jgi:hypothetical protein
MTRKRTDADKAVLQKPFDDMAIMVSAKARLISNLEHARSLRSKTEVEVYVLQAVGLFLLQIGIDVSS